MMNEREYEAMVDDIILQLFIYSVN